MGFDAARLFARVGVAGADETVRGLGRVSGQVNRTQGHMTGLGRTASRTGANLVKVGAIAGTALVGGIIGATRAAMDYESAFTGVRKTVDATEPQLTELSAGFRELSTEIPITAVRLANLGETAGALGVGAGSRNPIGAIKEFVRVTALIGETTDVSADQAATSLGALSNVMKLSEQDYMRFGSTLVDLGNKGASTESQILDIAARAGGLASAAGFSAAEVLGWSSAVANLGMQNELAGSSIQRFVSIAIRAVGQGGKSLRLFAQTAGLSVDEFKRLFEKDASGALETFIVGLSKLSVTDRAKVLKELKLNGVGLTTMFAGLTNNVDNLSGSLKIADAAWETNNALSVEAQERFDSVASQVGILKNTVLDAAITVGEGALPHVKRFAQEAAAFIKENDAEIRGLGASVGSFLGQIDFGEVLSAGREFIGVLKGAAGVAKVILDTIGKLPTEVKAAIVALVGLNKLTGGAVTEIGRGVIGGVGTGVVGRVPGIGSLVATPVRVVNWPPGFGTGTGTGPGSSGKGLSPLALLAAWGLISEVGGTPEPRTGNPEQAPIAGQETRRILELERRIEELRRQPAGSLAFPGNQVGNTVTAAQEIDRLTAEIAGLRGALEPVAASFRTLRAGDDRDAARQEATRAAVAALGVAIHRAGERNAGQVAVLQARLTAAAYRTKDDTVSAIRSAGAGTNARLGGLLTVNRQIRDKKRDVSVTVRPGTATFKIDGRQVARAILPYTARTRVA